ncbi:MAG TPA: calcium-binding protein [Allosphingosinicella sp.]|jgi:Ca2+-binding RTX toxin-like protein
MDEYGTEGDDLFVGDDEGNWYEALGGDDELRGNGGQDDLYGDAGADLIFGGADNDSLEGGRGSDRLSGGDGDDLLTGGWSFDSADRDKLFGGAGNDVIFGSNGAADELHGEEGADELYGYLGNDQLLGGAGSDYLSDREGADRYDGGEDEGLDWEGSYSFIGDRAQIGGAGGTDNMVVDLRSGIIVNDGFGNRESISGVESLGGGTLFADKFYADDRANHIVAANRDIVMGFGGDDLVSFSGAVGNFDGGAGVDSLLYMYGSKLIAGAGRGDPPQTLYTDNGVVIDLLAGTVRDGFGETGTIANVENIGGSHGGADDILRGDNKDNVIRGLGGADVIDGRGGNDTISYWQPEYYGHYGYWHRGEGAVLVDLAAGYAAETALTSGTVTAATPSFGRDSLAGIENIVGTGVGDRLLGNAGNNLIAPDSGSDHVDGRAGTDTVSYDGVRGAVAIDLAAGVGRQRGSGAPAVARVTDEGEHIMVEADDAAASLDRLLNIENAIGSAHGDRLAGTAGSNRLDGGRGDDMLVRSGGGDILVGGLGSDTADYSDAGAAVTIDLAAGSGSVRGIAAADRLLGIENAIGTAFADSLTGSRAANRLDGGAGIDRLDGGAGNDTYVVDDRRDLIADSAGVDRVEASFSLTLAAGLEQLVLTGAADLGGTGNDAANALTGNAGGNLLAGRGASDRIEGGAGRDAFLFDSALAGAGVDTILDFASADDSIRLDRSFFTGFAETGTLRLAAFRDGARAVDDSDRILYDEATGRIFYDADGSGAAAAILFAKVTPGTDLAAADFVIVG